MRPDSRNVVPRRSLHANSFFEVEQGIFGANDEEGNDGGENANKNDDDPTE